MKVNYIDLFSGIGGFPLGLIEYGLEFENHFYSEIDEYAIKVYEKRFPNAKGLGSITDVSGREFDCDIDIITAGFPCQDISVAGKQAGLEGKRSGLFYEIIRLAKVVSPRIIFLENVAALLSIDGGDAMGEVLRSLAEIGYDAEWHCVPASHVGAPHRRDRVWIVAYPNSERERTRHRNISEENGEVSKWNEDAEFSNTDKTTACSSWLTHWYEAATKFCRVDDGIPNRTHRLKALGNAVVPQVVTYVSREVGLCQLLKK